MDQPNSYPVWVDAELDSSLSRWQWIVKWLLALPHLLILVFLGIAQVILTLVAWVAILITGRYPRFIFDYNLGVLRWGWRVSCYAYHVVSTDRYPPFTLNDVPEYPAGLNVEYPERLSRLTTLFRLILAIPHLIVLYILVGDSYRWPGLRGILVLFAVIALLFTGRYPQPLFHLILGISRYGIRGSAYLLLMRDEYPPFSFDP